MSGAIDKKIIDIKKELNDSPTTHLSARTGILDSVTLSRQFAQTYLNALCEKFTSSTGSYSLDEICVALAKQRNICFGAKAIATGSLSFDLPSYETVNGALLLTEPNTSFMGIKATDIGETYTINLTSLAGTQTQGINTFSTDVRDYYLVRSRVTGELIDINDSITPYSTPDSDTAFGNAIAWGQDVTTESGTWNADFAKANIASVATQNEDTFKELNTMTLQDHLEQGSNTSYTTLGPAFGQKFYLKRHTDYVNTFTIIGYTTENSIEVTGISDSDLSKIKYGDVISGTGIPDDNVTIAGVKSADSKLRLSNTGIATTTGTVTLTVNSVPFGYAENDIFCQVEIVGEGLVTNEDWMPVGDDAGDYSAADASPDALLNANTSQFIGLLGFFDPGNVTGSGENDLTKGASYTSEGKEYNGTSYPDIEKNPVFPATAGTSKEHGTKQGELTGTQPSGLSDKDVYCGRYVSWTKDRQDGTPQKVGEYRYKVDNAEKYFYAPPSHLGYDYGTTGDVVADPNHPPTVLAAPPAGSETEPRNICPRVGMTSIVTRVGAASVTIGATAVTTSHTTTVPADDAIYYGNPASGLSGTGPTATNQGGVAGTGDRNGFIGTYYQQAANGIMCAYQTKVTIDVTTTCGTSTYTAAYTEHLIGPFQTYYNHVQKHMFEASTSTANTDVAFIMDTVDQLQLVDGFRDPITTGVAAPRSASGGTAGPATVTGISDAAFDTYLASEPEGDHGLLQTGMTKFRANFAASGRAAAGAPSSGSYPRARATGSAVNFASFTQDSTAYNCQTLWTNFVTELETFRDNCNARVSEIDARIGVPTYSGSVASRGNPPTIRVSAIPASNTTNGVLPYGRSIFNNVNHLLGQEADLLGGIITAVESLSSLVDLVKSARNKYDIFSGRDKTY